MRKAVSSFVFLASLSASFPLSADGTPKFRAAPSFDCGDVRAVMVEGERWKGRETRFFARYAVPKWAKEKHKVPGVVLVPGRDESASSEWVEYWTARGYAAIVPDCCGGCPPHDRAVGRLTHPFAGPSDDSDPGWLPYAVSAVRRSLDFLRNLPEVDAERIGVVGRSVGRRVADAARERDARFLRAYDGLPELKAAAERDPLRGKVAFLGDSITAGGDYITYLVLFKALREPDSPMDCMNVGRVGDTSGGGIARWSWDAEPFQPDSVVVMFGMNDIRQDCWKTVEAESPDEYAARERALADYAKNLDTIRRMMTEKGRTVTFLTPTPYDSRGSQENPAKLGCNDPALTRCAAIVRDMAERRGLPLVDLHAPMTEIAGRQDLDPALRSDDRVHPSVAGHLLMAALILDALGRSGPVSETTVDAAGGGRAAFDYVPRALPLPLTSEYRAVDKVWPLTDRLNREMLSVRNLKPGEYVLSVDGKRLGRFSERQLADGVNLALFDTPNRRLSEALEKSRRRLRQIVLDNRTVRHLVRELEERGVDVRKGGKPLADFIAEERAKAQKISWGWQLHAISLLESMAVRWQELDDERSAILERFRNVKPVLEKVEVCL